MREIKFRAWDKVSKDWHYIEITKSIFETQMAIPSQPMMHGGQVDGLEWQQYTGLKDKNGVEIYDGDIVLDGDDVERVVEYAAPYFSLHKVEFIKGRNEASTNNYWIDNKYFSTPFAYEEVIGNIWENPELLEAGE